MKRSFQRIGVLTGGGDVPGLNTAIKTLVRRMEEGGLEVLGLRRGWQGLLDAGGGAEAAGDDRVQPLDRASTRRIDRSGGTVLHTSRLNPSLLLPHQVPAELRDRVVENEAGGTFDATAVVVEAIARLGLDALVPIGGDGTLAFAERLHREGVPLVAIPKTMDNDVHGTDYSIGFSTAVTRAVHFINDLRTTAGSHERFMVVELFGRRSGEPCLLASYLADTDRALIAEVPYERERLIGLLREDKRRNPSNYAVLTVSEGAHPVGGQPLERGGADGVGHRRLGGIGAVISEDLERATGERALYQPLGYLMRSGPPDSLDQLVASNFANLAADLLLEGKSGFMAALVGGRYAPVSIERVVEGERGVEVERFYDSEAYRPKIADIASLPMFLH